MKRKVDKTLFPYVELVMHEDGISYSAVECSDWIEMDMDISSRRFNVVIEDAKCERQRLDSDCPQIPVVSFRTAVNPDKVDSVLKRFKTNVFMLLSCDEARFANMTI